MKIKIEKLGDDFQVLLDGAPSGIYSTEQAAKRGARRFFRTHLRVKWNRQIDGVLMGVAEWSPGRKPGESF